MAASTQTIQQTQHDNACDQMPVLRVQHNPALAAGAYGCETTHAVRVSYNYACWHAWHFFSTPPNPSVDTPNDCGIEALEYK